MNPLLYVHSFINSKDLPFLSLFLVCLYLNALAFDRNSLRRFVVLGLFSGLLIDIRIMGVLLPCLVLFFLLADAIREQAFARHAKLGLGFLVATCPATYAAWPFLWKNPIGNFVFAFENMSAYRWVAKVLFDGSMRYTTQLPWHYIPVWFAITTPVIYLLSGLIGVVILAWRMARAPRLFLANNPVRNNLVFAGCVFLPLAAVILLHSVLYDGWRQMFFIYPSFIMLALFGYDYFIKKKYGWLVTLSALAGMISIGVFMVRTFPLQHVYYNAIVADGPPGELRHRFEMDYWAPPLNRHSNTC